MICIENVSKDYFSLFSIFFLTECAKKEKLSLSRRMKISHMKYTMKLLNALNGGEYFLAAQKFSEAEKILPIVDQSAKALLMSSYCFYSINFYDDAISSLENFLRKYPADKNVEYAEYLIALTNYDQILDEKKI